MRYRRSPSYAHPWLSWLRAAAYRVGTTPLQAPAAESMWQNACDRGGRAHGGRHILPLVLPLVLPLAPTEPPDIGKDDDMRAPVSLGIAAPFALDRKSTRLNSSH